MFKMKRGQKIESDEGFSVQMLGKAGLTYREGKRTLFVDSELLAFPHGILIFPDTIKQWEKTQESISEAEKKRIVDNIMRACHWAGIEVKIMTDSS